MYSREEKQFLKNYSIKDFDVPLTTVDNCIFTLHEESLKVLLVKREDFPCKEQWSIPGGFVDLLNDDDLSACALRRLREKTGVDSPYLEQCETVGNKQRDPRGWAVTTLYFALIPYIEPQEVPGKGESRWFTLNNKKLNNLAFDHDLLIEKALNRLRSKVLYTTLPAHLLTEQFTLTALQKSYEIILGNSLEKKSFRRRMLASGVFEETGESTAEGAGRPAALYRLKNQSQEFVFNRQIESSC
jgi:ADP-ribose pyrophosphatase YjhB (NUDIX family)